MAPPYPGSRAELRDVLATLYACEADARRVAMDAGLEVSAIAFPGSAQNFWHALLEEAEKHEAIDSVVTVARRAYPRNSVLRAWGRATPTLASTPNRVLAPEGGQVVDHEEVQLVAYALLLLLSVVVGAAVAVLRMGLLVAAGLSILGAALYLVWLLSSSSRRRRAAVGMAAMGAATGAGITRVAGAATAPAVATTAPTPLTLAHVVPLIALAAGPMVGYANRPPEHRPASIVSVPVVPVLVAPPPPLPEPEPEPEPAAPPPPIIVREERHSAPSAELGAPPMHVVAAPSPDVPSPRDAGPSPTDLGAPGTPERVRPIVPLPRTLTVHVRINGIWMNFPRLNNDAGSAGAVAQIVALDRSGGTIAEGRTVVEIDPTHLEHDRGYGPVFGRASCTLEIRRPDGDIDEGSLRMELLLDNGSNPTFYIDAMAEVSGSGTLGTWELLGHEQIRGTYQESRWVFRRNFTRTR